MQLYSFIYCSGTRGGALEFMLVSLDGVTFIDPQTTTPWSESGLEGRVFITREASIGAVKDELNDKIAIRLAWKLAGWQAEYVCRRRIWGSLVER